MLAVQLAEASASETYLQQAAQRCPATAERVSDMRYGRRLVYYRDMQLCRHVCYIYFSEPSSVSVGCVAEGPRDWRLQKANREGAAEAGRTLSLGKMAAGPRGSWGRQAGKGRGGGTGEVLQQLLQWRCTRFCCTRPGAPRQGIMQTSGAGGVFSRPLPIPPRV